MPFHLDRLGVWSPEFRFRVEREDTTAFAVATNDPLPEHRDGLLAPPSFAWMPYWKSGLSDVIGRGVVDVSPEEQARQVHGQHDLHVHRPIVPGTTLRLRGRVLGVFAKSSGTALVTQTETTDEDGTPVNTQYATAFFRGVSSQGSAGSPGPAVEDLSSTPESPLQTSVRVDHDQPTRYAQASGDHNPIHLDEAAARAAGHPGVIAHGMSVFALLTHAAITALGEHDPCRLRRIGVRFTRPVLPGQTLTTSFAFAGHANGTRQHRFTTVNEDAQLVLSNGHVEMARP